MTSEKDDLLVKIETGEGANTALTQLKQENEGLAERLQSANQGCLVSLPIFSANIITERGTWLCLTGRDPSAVLIHDAFSICSKGFCLGSNFSQENVAALWASTTADGDCFGLNWLVVSFFFPSVGEEGGG